MFSSSRSRCRFPGLPTACEQTQPQLETKRVGKVPRARTVDRRQVGGQLRDGRAEPPGVEVPELHAKRVGGQRARDAGGIPANAEVDEIAEIRLWRGVRQPSCSAIS